jgi:hypothetical protein
MSDLTKADQVNAVQAVNEPYKNATAILTKASVSQLNSPNKEQRAKGERNSRTARTVTDRAVSLDEMAANRVENFTAAATTHKLPSEPYAGADFYFKNNAKIHEAVEGTSVSHASALDSAGALSAQVKPENEKVALKALVHAHDRGSVNFNPKLVSGLAAIGHTVPQHLHDKDVAWSDIPSDTASEMVHPDVRDIAVKSSTDIDIPSMAQVHQRVNIKQSIDAIRSTDAAPSPTDNPKKWGYNKSHELSVSNSPEHIEFTSRAHMVGEALRNNGTHQVAIDYHGLRDSNEGVLSNTQHTAEDSWQRAISLDKQDPRANKAAADELVVRSKSITKRGGRKVTIRKGDSTVTPVGIEHAVHHEATVMAAKEIQEKAGVDFTVPSIMVQEGGWAAKRRRSPTRVTENAAGEIKASEASQDPEWNEHVKSTAPKTGRAKNFSEGHTPTSVHPDQMTLF